MYSNHCGGGFAAATYISSSFAHVKKTKKIKEKNVEKKSDLCKNIFVPPVPSVKKNILINVSSAASPPLWYILNKKNEEN